MLDVERGHGRKAVEPRGFAGEHMLAKHLPYLVPVGDDVLMLRDGDVMASFMVEGIEALTAEQAAVGDLADAMGGGVAQSGSDVAFYVHRVSNPASVAMPPVEGQGFAAAVDRAWQAGIRVMGLRTRRIMVTVIVRPMTLTSLWARITGGGKRDLMAMRERRIARLNEVVGHMMGALSAASPYRLSVSNGEWLGMLQACVSGIYRPLSPGAEFRPLADLMASSRVDFRDDTFIVFGNDAEETRFGAIFTYKKYPTETQAGVFDGLDLPHDTVVTHSFTPIEQFEALARVQRTARQMRAADDAARSLEIQLVDAADDLASGRISFGLHQASITVFARSEAELDEVASRVRSAGQRTGGVMVREDIGARSAYFAQHPGNHSYRARAAMISSANFADFAALHANGEGLEPGLVPWGAPITTFRTLGHEPYRFSFHLAGKPGERTVGHSLIVGRTGSGKTAAIAFLMAQAQRIEPRPRIIAFDKDRGLEMALRALGGSYSAVRMGEQTGFNPFRAEGDARGTAWLTDWLGALLSQDGDKLSPMQGEALAQMTASNADADPVLQTISHFRSQLRGVDDDGDLYTRLAQWDEGGRYDWLFGGTAEDPLHFANDVTGFDLTELLDVPAVRTAWLSYVFRRIERTIEDGRPTLVVLDEAWKLLDDPYFQSRLKDWMLTMRKKNVAVVMLTQRVSHIADSRAGNSILESIATTILFPNSRNTQTELAPLGLSDGETEFLMSSGSGNRYASIRSGDRSVFVDMDLGALGPLLTALVSGPGGENSPPTGEKIPASGRSFDHEHQDPPRPFAGRLDGRVRKLHRRKVALPGEDLRMGSDQPRECRSPMKRMIRTLAASIVVVSLGSIPAHAEGVPVIDGAAIAQFIKQLEQMQKDYENQLEQLTNLQDQLESMTGDKGIGGILNSATDQSAREAADSLSSIIDSAISGGGLSGNTSVISDRISELKDTFGLADLTQFLGSERTQDRALATQAGSGMAAVATAEDTYQRANASMDRVNGMIEDIDSNADLKASVDYNTRMLAEVAVLLNENLRVQAAIANTVGTDAISSARDRAAQRKFMTGAGSSEE